MASVVILYSVINRHPGEATVSHDELQARETVQAIQASLRELGHLVTPLRAVAGFTDLLRTIQPDAVMNLATGIHRKLEQANVVGMLEMCPYPFTGSGLVPTVVALDKATAKQVFSWHGIPTPRFRVFGSADALVTTGLTYPLLVKPVREGSGIGIHQDAVVSDQWQLLDRVDRILNEHQQPALVEEYIDGRELTVGILGWERLQVLPVMEILFDGAVPARERIYSYEVKIADNVGRCCPAQLTAQELSRVQAAALSAYQVLGCRDYARVDLRLDRDGTPFVLEINTLPGLQPGYSEYPRLAAIAGWDYTQLVGQLLTFALQRGGGNRDR